MATPDLNKVSEEFRVYFNKYFSSAIDGLDYSTVSGTDIWQDYITTDSGVDMMLTDLVMLAEGLSKSFNVPDTVYVPSGTRYSELENILPDTNTSLLFENLELWRRDEDTIYANYLYGKIVEIMVQSDPSIRLSKWFGLDHEQADIMWNLIVLYKEEGTNLDDAYVNAIKLFENEEYKAKKLAKELNV